MRWSVASEDSLSPPHWPVSPASRGWSEPATTTNKIRPKYFWCYTAFQIHKICTNESSLPTHKVCCIESSQQLETLSDFHPEREGERVKQVREYIVVRFMEL